MPEQSETYVRTDEITGEKTERVVLSQADRVAAQFAGYHPKSTKAAKAAAEDGDAKKAPAADETK